MKHGVGFQGSWKLIGVIAIVGILAGIGAPGSAKYGVFLVFALPIVLYYWLKYHTAPRLIAATAIPPPDLSPPGSGLLRATIARRKATYRHKGLAGRTETKHEFLCWLVLSETARAIVRKDSLQSIGIFSLPKSDEYLDQARAIDPALARDKEWTYTLKDFLEHPPLYIGSSNAVSINIVDQQVREGLKNFNDFLTASVATPTSRSESFEL